MRQINLPKPRLRGDKQAIHYEVTEICIGNKNNIYMKTNHFLMKCYGLAAGWPELAIDGAWKLAIIMHESAT
jgi:hypothetical protein